MDPLTVIGVARSALAIAQELYALGKDVSPYLAKVGNILVKGKETTEEELAEIQAQSDAYSDEILKPLEPEQE